jgi:hypothetical protein
MFRFGRVNVAAEKALSLQLIEMSGNPEWQERTLPAIFAVHEGGARVVLHTGGKTMVDLMAFVDSQLPKGLIEQVVSVADYSSFEKKNADRARVYIVSEHASVPAVYKQLAFRLQATAAVAHVSSKKAKTIVKKWKLRRFPAVGFFFFFFFFFLTTTKNNNFFFKQRTQKK